MRCAVIDLGTNTFHLLIAERKRNGQPWKPIFRERIYVKLAEDGIEEIGAPAFERAIQAVLSFSEQLEASEVPLERVKAVGTAALRTAENAPELIEAIYRASGIRAEIVPGEREAELIYKGARQAVPFPKKQSVLIMDIGGGSVEFILADKKQIFWAQSFPIGVAVLHNKFPHSDPIVDAEIAAIEAFIDTALADLWAELEKHPRPALVGASGTFDVIDMFLMDPDEKHPLYGYVSTAEFLPLYEKFVHSTLAERREMKNLPPERVELIVVAIILIQRVLQHAGITDIYTSTYALKEGLLEELGG
jgi:exopolyphosphatase/guanosine-5'-triphosphate,3'-diphosphate pyrophosphatase